MRVTILAILGFTLGSLSFSDASELPALPPRIAGLEPKHVIQSPAGSSSRIGHDERPAVIWFWASWCAPCVEHVPAYNRMVEKWASRGVTFVAVTPESPETVKGFLARAPIQGWIFADPEGRLTGALNVRTYPTMLVTTRADPQPNRVAGDSIPDGVLAAALSGQPVAIPIPARPASTKDASPSRPVAPNATDSERDLIRTRLSVTPIPEKGAVVSRVSMERSWFQAGGVTLSTLIEQAYGIPSWQVEWEALQPRERFDAVVDVPGDETSRWRGILQSLVTDGFGLAVSREKREVTSYLLTGNPGRLTKSTPGDGASKITQRPGSLDAIRIGVDGLSVTLSQILNAPVGTAIHSTESYDIHLEWTPDDERSLIHAVENLGLEVQTHTGIEEHLIVRVATCGQAPATTTNAK